MIIEIVLNSSVMELNKTFDYKVPEQLVDLIKIGQRVFVPFGKRSAIGYVTKIKDKSEYELKYINEIIDDVPLLNEEDILLGKEISKHFFTSLGKSFELMIPTGLKNTINKNLIVKNKKILDERLKPLFKNSDVIKYSADLKKYQNLICNQLEKNILELSYSLSQKGTIKKVVYLSYKNDYLGKSIKAKELLNYLKEINEPVKKKNILDLGYSISTINTLIKNNAISQNSIEKYRQIEVTEVKDKNIVLNSEQENAFNIIKQSLNIYSKFLIHGVCGSGKTEIYLNLIDEVLKEGKTAIMLIPEISLTPQMSSRFKVRFNEKLAIMHSSLTINERYDEYRRIKNGEAKVVLGVRSAIFAPLKNIGLIIMDEEQEDSYIQNTTPMYDTHFVSNFRAKYNNCPLVLGSATPLVSTYYKALNREYELIELKKRANNKLQESSCIVDMREELKKGNRTVFSEKLKEEVIKTYNKNEQSILFINRRGYSSFVMCRSCGTVIKCPHCDVPLTYHKTTNTLKCHYCGYEIQAPKVCPECGSKAIRYVGDGTQKVESEIKKILPEARVVRMDKDSINSKNTYTNIIDKINNHEADILLGTQSVAKGLDFPLVSLVGVVNSDLGLNMPFYDSYEKTYDIIEQVSGRAGRKDTIGNTIIQTYSPKNIAILSASVHSYLSFYKSEIKKRKITFNPPFSDLIEIVVTSKLANDAYKESLKIKNWLKKIKNAVILGPVPDRIYKLNNLYRFLLTVKISPNSDLSVINEISSFYLSLRNVKVYIKRK